MEKQVIKTATICAVLLFLFPLVGFVTILFTTEINGNPGHADTHKRWQKQDDDIESRANKLEPKIWALREGPKKRKAENILKEIRNLLEEQRNIPGKAYRLTMELKDLLES